MPILTSTYTTGHAPQQNWVQWDSDLRTFRGQVNGVTYGTRGSQFLTPAAWATAAGVSLDARQTAELEGERDNWIAGATDREPVVLAPVEFLRLMTEAEIQAVLTASDSSIAVRAWLYRFERAQTVNRVHADTVRGIAALHAAGLLSDATRSRILDGE